MLFRSPEGPICPHCGGTDRIGKLQGKSTRVGTYKCYQCRKPFTVKVGTVFEDSHVPMRFWLQAMYLLCSSKKGISSNQLSRTLGVTLKTAWFMSHRIREAMRVVGVDPMGGSGKIVEADETYIGHIDGSTKERGAGHKNAVLTLVERGGSARSFHVDSTSIADIVPVVRASSVEEANRAIEAICAGGIPVVEITMTVPNAISVIRELVQRRGSDVLIGAGTVTNADQAE